MCQLLLFMVCLFVTWSANAQAPRLQRSDTPIVPKKGVFGAGIKPPIINIAKPQACIDSLYLYNKKIKERDDSITLYHPEVNTYGEYIDMRTMCKVEVDIDFFKEALHKRIKNKMVYTLMIRAEDMRRIGIEFSQLNIPEGAEIYAYTSDRKQIANKFNEWGNFKRMYILQGAGIPTLGNNEVIIEYAEPIIKHSKRHKSNIKINRV